MLTLGSGVLLVRLPRTRTLPLSTRIARHCFDCQHSCPISLHTTSRKSFLTRDPGHLHPASFLEGIDRISLSLTSAIDSCNHGRGEQQTVDVAQPPLLPAHHSFAPGFANFITRKSRVRWRKQIDTIPLRCFGTRICRVVRLDG